MRSELPLPLTLQLEVYDALGQHIRTLVSGSLPAGRHIFHWNGMDQSGQPVASGVYLYRLEVISNSGQGERFVKNRKMLLLK
jgi:flagellar hook assembly protein FlgD